MQKLILFLIKKKQVPKVSQIRKLHMMPDSRSAESGANFQEQTEINSKISKNLTSENLLYIQSPLLDGTKNEQAENNVNKMQNIRTL